MTQEDLTSKKSLNAQSKAENSLELKQIIQQTRKLLNQIEDAVPLINLAITTSGANLSTALPATISLSRLFQATTFLTAGDTQYSNSDASSVQIGPSFTLSLYMLFSGHIRPQTEEDIRQSTWKEAIHKARVKLMRVPLDKIYQLPDDTTNSEIRSSTRSNGTSFSRVEAANRIDEFAYQIVIIEDLEDDRVHAYDDHDIQPSSYGGVEIAGIREVLPVHEISKIFYADTGKILNIASDGEINSPVLLLKRDVNAAPPRRMMERDSDYYLQEPVDDGDHVEEESYRKPGPNTNEDLLAAQFEREQRSSSVPSASPQKTLQQSDLWLPANLDPEWLAFEIYVEPPESDAESEAESAPNHFSPDTRSPSLDPQMIKSLADLHLGSTPAITPSPSHRQTSYNSPQSSFDSAIRPSLSLLETLLRLLSLQQFQQTSHLFITDEYLNFFLSESATTGAVHGDDRERRRLRDEARARVGFDPYNESPIKRRGEEYQYGGGESEAGWEGGDGEPQYAARSAREPSYDGFTSPRFDEGYGTHRFSPSPRPARYELRGTPPPPPPPETPPLLLSNHPHSARGHSSDRSLPGLSRSASSGTVGDVSRLPETPSKAFSGRFRPGRAASFDPVAKEVVRRGSPLARMGTGTLDEGSGSGPGS